MKVRIPADGTRKRYLAIPTQSQNTWRILEGEGTVDVFETMENT